MSSLSAYFTDAELLPIRNGMRTFIRLTGMIHDDFQYRWFADEADGRSSIVAIARAFKRTERMLGKMKYQGVPFDAPRQVREDLTVSMLGGADENSMVANRKRYSPLYYLVVEPIVNLLAKFDHQTILNITDEVCDGFVEMLEATDCYGTFDDALIAQAMTRKLIADREEAAKAIKAQRKSRTKKKEKETNFFEVDAEVVDEIIEDEPVEEVEE